MSTKPVLAFLCAAFSLISLCHAGEATLTRTWQPLSELGGGGIRIEQVTCYDWYGLSGEPTQIGLICAPNHPPTNAPRLVGDTNLASVCGLKFVHTYSEKGEKPLIYLNATRFAVPEEFGSDNPQDILKAALECLRRVLPENLVKEPVILKTQDDAARKWMEPILAAFNQHDRTKEFFAPKN